MKFLFMIGVVFWMINANCQDTGEVKKAWALSGYVKELAWLRFDKPFDKATATNLLHNRLNVKWIPAEAWSGRVEIRNRFYWGEDVNDIPGFTNQLRNDGDAVNLSVNWVEANSTVLHSNVERLWMEYNQDRWRVRAGRQRINWGVANTWNPNDIFNSYNFLDFDYEERPGSDAVKAQYQLSDLANMELAVAATGSKPILAARYFTNYHKYDLQINAGVYQGVFTTGIGWAGSIAEAGFKGEVQYYTANENELSQLLMSVEGDYIFKNGWYLSAALLYNQRGLHEPLNDWTKLVFQPSPRNLMPTKWNMLLSASKEFTPLFNGSLNLAFAPGTNLLIVFPAVRYNVKHDWDVDFVWQSFFAQAQRFEALSHSGYIRLRWSF